MIDCVLGMCCCCVVVWCLYCVCGVVLCIMVVCGDGMFFCGCCWCVVCGVVFNCWFVWLMMFVCFWVVRRL